MVISKPPEKQQLTLNNMGLNRAGPLICEYVSTNIQLALHIHRCGTPTVKDLNIHGFQHLQRLLEEISHRYRGTTILRNKLKIK